MRQMMEAIVTKSGRSDYKCVISRQTLGVRLLVSPSQGGQSEARPPCLAQTVERRWARRTTPLPALRSSRERRRQERRDDDADQRIFRYVIDALVPGLHALADEAHVIDVAEGAVDPADVLALFVLGRALVDDVGRDPAVHRGHRAGLERTLDVAEQDDAVVAGGVLGIVQIGLVEQQILAVMPGVVVAVDDDAALAGRFRRDEAEMIAQRAGI